MRIAVIVGHRPNRKGAFSDFLQVSEYDYMNKVVQFLPPEYDIYYRKDFSAISEAGRIKELTRRINQKSYDLVLSLHFNAAEDSKAHGATALHYITNRYTKYVAEKFIELCDKRFYSKKRYPIPISSKRDNGGTLILNCKSPVVILEPFFGSNEVDSFKYMNREKEYADLIVELINEVK